MTKDEMKDEMKDKISMALKDPILQMGFEVICSKLARLEKENTELEEQIEQMKCCENCRYYSRTYGHCYQYDSYQNCKSLSNWRQQNDKKYIKNDYKGVEIVLFTPKGGNIPPTPIQVETEQFISEAEK